MMSGKVEQKVMRRVMSTKRATPQGVTTLNLTNTRGHRARGIVLSAGRHNSSAIGVRFDNRSRRGLSGAGLECPLVTVTAKSP